MSKRYQNIWDDPIAVQYYHEAWKYPNLEAPSRNFWSYLLQNDGYPEDCFWLTSEHPTAGEHAVDEDLRRRIDSILNYKEADGKGGISGRRMLTVIQAKKPNATKKEIEVCEEQTFSAARAATEAGIPFCYALTTIGPRYVYRQFKAHGDRFEPIFAEDREACRDIANLDNYSDPLRDQQKWNRYVQATKDLPPSPIYGFGGRQAAIYTPQHQATSSTAAQTSNSGPADAKWDGTYWVSNQNSQFVWLNKTWVQRPFVASQASSSAPQDSFWDGIHHVSTKNPKYVWQNGWVNRPPTGSTRPPRVGWDGSYYVSTTNPEFVWLENNWARKPVPAPTAAPGTSVWDGTYYVSLANPAYVWLNSQWVLRPEDEDEDEDEDNDEDDDEDEMSE